MTPTPDESGLVTIGELGRRLDRIDDEWKHGVEGLHQRLSELNFVHPETLDTKLLLESAHRNDLERRVTQLESANQWLWRTVAGILMSALILGVLAASGFPR